MSKAKYIQREETRYGNNEYKDMPSIDYKGANGILDSTSVKRLDIDKVKQICKKYGFEYTFITTTYSSELDFVLYTKTNLTEESYKEIGAYVLSKCYTATFQRMHDCAHELDQETDLFFKVGWVGNYGVFGCDDIERESYSGGSAIISYKTIENIWSPIIHRNTLPKGVYILMTTHSLKNEEENSPKLEDYEPKLLDITKSLLTDEYIADYENGKRQCDTNSEKYKALIIRYKKNNRYCCMMRFFRNWLGNYTIYSARPLCGESSWPMDWANPIEDIKAALGSCATR